MKIQILTDKTSWFNKYSNILKDKLHDLGHDVQLINSKNELQNGDIAFFLSCFEIVGNEYLKLHEHNLVVHESNLPEGKGWSPMTWQIIEGKNEIPIALFEAQAGVDSGDIWLKDTIKLNGYELIKDWQKLQAEKTIEMCLKFIKEYNNLKPKKQQGNETFYKRRTPKDSELDINKSIKDQFNLLRTVDNEKYPAFFKVGNSKYTIKIYNSLRERERERIKPKN